MRKRRVKDDKNDGEADKKLAETTPKDGKEDKNGGKDETAKTTVNDLHCVTVLFLRFYSCLA